MNVLSYVLPCHLDRNAMINQLSNIEGNYLILLLSFCAYVCSWTEEINQRQCEMVAARVAAETLRQKEQVLIDEIEKFRVCL